jgi:NAD(P)-dependent dehydrogenase (short-subunit alcohol dehydrogenase family)
MTAPSPRRFEDKAVVVTSAGRGLGRAAAIAFALEGARVLIADPNLEDANATAETILRAGGRCHVVRADPVQADEAQMAMEEAARVFGGVDALFAGPPDAAATDFDGVLLAHLTGAFHAARHGLPHLLKTGGAMVLTAGTDAPGADAIAHSAAAGGVATLVRNIAHQYGPQGVRANAIALGGSDISLPPGVSLAGPAVRGEKADATRLVLFLASSEASYVTGAVLGVGGGGRS